MLLLVFNLGLAEEDDEVEAAAVSLFLASFPSGRNGNKTVDFVTEV